MKTKKVYFQFLTSFVIFFMYSPITLANPINPVAQSIEKLAATGQIKVNISSLGGHQEECVAFTICNQSNNWVTGFVEPGRRLISNNENEQDILIVKEMDFALAPKESKTMNGYGFCCQSSNLGPSKGSGYSLGQMTDDNWQALSRVINQADYPAEAIQHAVWVMSDGHDIRSIPAFGDENTSALRQSVADILGIEIPWYSFLYEEDSTRVFSGVANRLFAELGFTVPRRTMISGQIHDKNGNLVYNFPSYYTSEGTHNFHINMPLNTIEPGIYTLSIIEDFGILNTQKKFQIGEEI